MAISDDTQTERSKIAAVIPNFREDERMQARYEAMLARRIKDFGIEHEGSIRRNASAKSDELRHELDDAQAEWERRKTVLETFREAYRKQYPHHVKKTRVVEPTAFENLKSFGAANRLYKSASEAWHSLESATSNIRRIEHNETQLGVELERALERAPQVSKEVTESAKWLAEIHAEEELGGVKAKVDAILAERENYEKRLAAGTVSAEEVRLRAFSSADIKHLQLPVSQFIFSRIETFGPAAYFVLRDSRKTYYALPYDVRLEPLLNVVHDINRVGKEFDVRRTTKDNGLPMSLLDHFMRCNDNKDVAAQEALREQQEFVKQKRTYVTNGDCDETEATAIALLAAFAAAKSV